MINGSWINTGEYGSSIVIIDVGFGIDPPSFDIVIDNSMLPQSVTAVIEIEIESEALV